MSIAMNSQCLECNLKRNLALARSLGTEEQAMAFAKALMQLHLNAPENAPSPYLGPQIADLLHEMYGLPIDRYHQEKIDSNRFFLDREEQIREKVESAPDPVYAGLQFAILGNYLDFSALQGNVSFDTLEDMLSKALEMELDRDCYSRFLKDLETGKTLLYLTDNAGEIGFDKIFAQQIQKRFPHLEITFCVRGAICQNDATRADAQEVGLPFPLMDNGSRIAGNMPEHVSPEARAAMERADVVLAKGMGNVETMYGCPYHVYYAFLVKCQHFIDIFKKPLFTPMFVEEPHK